MRPMHITFLSLAGSLLLLMACSDDNSGAKLDGTVAKDMAQADKKTVQPDMYPDLGVLPDLPPKGKCESEWKVAISPQSTVSKGSVVTTDVAGGLKQTTIDATAGGMSGANSNPYVYISFKDGGVRVDIDDLTAKTSNKWDMAFKRAVIRVNGGDSGAGQGALAILGGKTIDQVTSVPSSSSFATDDFLDDNCKLKTDPINNILTAIGGSSGMWYDMDTSTMKLTPKKETYVVQLAAGGFIKLVIDSYYGTSGTPAMYTVRWSALK